MHPHSDADRAFHAYLDAGRPEDLAIVFDALAPRLLLLASHVAGQPGEAEDLVQATFLRAIERSGSFQRGRPVLPWLTGILVLEAKKARRTARRMPDPGRLTAPESAGPDAAAELDELREVLGRALAQLPDAYAEVLTLRLVHGLTPTEIAHALRLSPETVKTRLKRGAARLRPKLPVALAGLLAALVTPGHSLSIVRDAVLANAAPFAVTSASAVTGLGSSAVRTTVGKWLAGAAVTAALAVTVWQLAGGDEPPEEPLRRTPVALDRSPDRPDPVRTDVAGGPVQAGNEVPPDLAPVFASIEGRCRDTSGPVAGVELTLLRLHEDALLTAYAPIPESLTDATFVAGRALTDVGGRFVMDRVRPGGVWLLRVAPPDGPAFVRLVAIRQAPEQRVDVGWLELEQPRFAYGRIVDQRLRPIEGARMRPVPGEWTAAADLGLVGKVIERYLDPLAEQDALVAVPGRTGFCVVAVPEWVSSLRMLLEHATVRADPRGRFAWQAVGCSEVEVVAEADGFTPRTLTMRLGYHGEDVGDVILEPLRSIELTVVDAHRDPVPDAEVALGTAVELDSAVLLRRVGRTSVDGVLRVPWRDAPLCVAVRAGAGDAFFATRLPARAIQTVRLPPRHSVELRCVERSGVRVEEFDVRLLPGSQADDRALGYGALHQLGGLAAVDLQGRLDCSEPGTIRIAGVAEGEWTALVAAAGHVPVSVPLTVLGPTTRRIELVSSEPLRVSLVDQGFRPLRGVEVVARGIGDSGGSHPLGAVLGRTDVDASLVFERFLYADFGLAVAAPGFGWRTALVAAGARDLHVILREQGALVCNLVSTAESFCATDFLVVAQRARETWDVVSPSPAFVAPQPDGRVEIGDLEPGTYRIEARPPPPPIDDLGDLLQLLFENDRPADRPIAVLEVAPMSTTTLRFDPVAASAPAPVSQASFGGRFLVDGAPARGGSVQIERDGQVESLPLGTDGRFDAGGTPAGTVDVSFLVPGFTASTALWRARVEIGAEPPTLEVDVRTSPLSMQLLTPSGTRAGGVEVQIEGAAATTPPGRVRISAQADAAGFIAIDRLPHGQYSLLVHDAGLGWLRDQLTVGPAWVTTGASISLHPLLRVAGRVDERALGIDVPWGSEVEFERIDEDGIPLRRVAECRDGGVFETSGLFPGRYRITLGVAQHIASAVGGGTILIRPSATGIFVPLADFDVPERDLSGVAFARRR